MADHGPQLAPAPAPRTRVLGVGEQGERALPGLLHRFAPALPGVHLLQVQPQLAVPGAALDRAGEEVRGLGQGTDGSGVARRRRPTRGPPPRAARRGTGGGRSRRGRRRPAPAPRPGARTAGRPGRRRRRRAAARAGSPAAPRGSSAARRRRPRRPHRRAPSTPSAVQLGAGDRAAGRRQQVAPAPARGGQPADHGPHAGAQAGRRAAAAGREGARALDGEQRVALGRSDHAADDVLVGPGRHRGGGERGDVGVRDRPDVDLGDGMPRPARSASRASSSGRAGRSRRVRTSSRGRPAGAGRCAP